MVLNTYIADGALSEEKNAKYSILQHSVRTPEDIAEISKAIGENDIKRLITFDPIRLAYYETIISIQSETKSEDEKNFKKLFEEIFDKDIKPIIEREEVVFAEIKDKILNRAQEAYYRFFHLNTEEQNQDSERIKIIYEKIFDRFSKGLYIPNKDLEFIAKDIFYDQIYMEEMYNKIKNLVLPIILNKIEIDSNLVKLEEYPCENRQAIIICGGSGAGKSSIEQEIAETENINLHNYLKINTDFYRPLVSLKEKNGLSYIEYNNDESALLAIMIGKRMYEKFSTGKAPNILINTSNLTEERLNSALYGGVNVCLNILTKEPQEAIEDVFERGKKEGRYIPTHYLIRSYKHNSNFLYDEILEKYKGQKIKLKVFNFIKNKDRYEIIESSDLEDMNHMLDSPEIYPLTDPIHPPLTDIENIAQVGETITDNPNYFLAIGTGQANSRETTPSRFPPTLSLEADLERRTIDVRNKKGLKQIYRQQKLHPSAKNTEELYTRSTVNTDEAISYTGSKGLKLQIFDTDEAISHTEKIQRLDHPELDKEVEELMDKRPSGSGFAAKNPKRKFNNGDEKSNSSMRKK